MIVIMKMMLMITTMMIIHDDDHGESLTVFEMQGFQAYHFWIKNGQLNGHDRPLVLISNPRG